MNTALSGANAANLLRRSLVTDGVVAAVAGIALTLGAGILADPLGLPISLLRFTGIGLLPYAAVLLTFATRGTISHRPSWAVVGLNLLWVSGSLTLLMVGWVHPTTLGIVFILVQALLVATLADVELLALRRSA